MATTSTIVQRSAWTGVVGGALTALSGLLVQTVVIPSTTVPDKRWSYPWSATAFVYVSTAYCAIHLLVIAGLVAFARSGAAGPGRMARTGTVLAIAGTATLAAAEVLGLPFRQQPLSDAGPSAIGALFGVGTLLSAVGLILAGIATRRTRRWTGLRRQLPLVAGLWTLLVAGLAPTPALSSAVAVYGLLIAALCHAVATESRSRSGNARTRATVLP